MSLNSFLNNETTNNAKPPVSHVFRRKVCQQPKEEVKPQESPNNTAENTTHPTIQILPKIKSEYKQEPTKRDEETLLFSIISKIYLPKEISAKIDFLFMKLLQCKISFPTLSSSIYELVSKYPKALTIWNIFLGRNDEIQDPLTLKVREVIKWFIQNEYSSVYCIHFMKFLVDAKQQNLSSIELFDEILNNESFMYPTQAIKSLFSFALDLYPDIPTSHYHQVNTQDEKQKSIPEILGYVPFSHLFTIPKRLPDSTSMNKKPSHPDQNLNGKQPLNDSTNGHGNTSVNQQLQSTSSGSHFRHSAPPPKLYTPSHNKHLIPFPSSGLALLFNFLTKSAQVGQEGGSHPHPHYHIDVPPPTRDIHELLESMEVLEHAIDEIEGFDENCQTYNYVVFGAGKYIYSNHWSEIERFLPSFNVRKFIIKRCHEFLGQISNELLEAQHFSRQFLETQPTNSFICSLNPPQLDSPFTFPFPFYETNISSYLKMLILSQQPDKNKYTSLLWFTKEVLPRFQVLDLLPEESIKQTVVEFYGPKSLVCAIWYFSLLCEELAPVYNQDPIQLETWNSVLNNVTETIITKFSIDTYSSEYHPTTAFDRHLNISHLIHGQPNYGYPKGFKKPLTKILKSIITNRTIMDEKAEKVIKHFGNLSQNISHFLPIFSRFNRSASMYRNDPHRNELIRLAEMFGHAKGENAINELNEMRTLYRTIIDYPSREQFFLFKFDFENNTISIILDEIAEI